MQAIKCSFRLSVCRWIWFLLGLYLLKKKGICIIVTRKQVHSSRSVRNGQNRKIDWIWSCERRSSTCRAPALESGLKAKFNPMSCADRGGWRNIVNPQKLKEQRVKGQGKDVIEGPQQQMGKSSLTSNLVSLAFSKVLVSVLSIFRRSCEAVITLV